MTVDTILEEYGMVMRQTATCEMDNINFFLERRVVTGDLLYQRSSGVTGKFLIYCMAGIYCKRSQIEFFELTL